MKKLFVIVTFILLSAEVSGQVLGIPLGSSFAVTKKAIEFQNVKDTVVNGNIFTLSPVKIGGHWTKSVIFAFTKRQLSQVLVLYNNEDMNESEMAALLTVKYGKPDLNVGKLYVWKDVKGTKIFLNHSEDGGMYIQYLYLKLHPLRDDKDAESL